MSQSIGMRYEIIGTLTCESPIHVGGWDTSAEADLVIARDGSGQPFLPGTSIAGAVRAYLLGTGRFDETQVRGMFGHVVPNSREGSPSWIRFDDAALMTADARPIIRDGVGIDRVTASAAEGFLYTTQVLPAGTKFALRIVADTPTAASAPASDGWQGLIRDAVDTIITGLTSGEVPIGAGRGRGFGRVRLSDLQLRGEDLSDPAGLVAWLTGAARELSYPLGESDGAAPTGGGRLTISISWRPVSPVLVRDSMDGTVVDALPLTETAADGSVRLLLPGSSIRGVIRSHAERIIRTLTGEDADPSFDEALRRPPDGIDLLFGVAPDRQSSEPGRRGVLSFVECRGVNRLAADDWNAIVAARPAEGTPTGADRSARERRDDERDRARRALRQRLRRIGASVAFDLSDHVAIDRWTGGASEGRLFSVLDPSVTVEWEPIRIVVDVDRLYRLAELPGTSPPALALPLLLLVLRDLRDGWISLGYGSTRGRGQIQVDDVTFEGERLPEPWGLLAGRTLDSVLASPPAEITATMAAWAERFTKEAA